VLPPLNRKKEQIKNQLMPFFLQTPLNFLIFYLLILNTLNFFDKSLRGTLKLSRFLTPSFNTPLPLKKSNLRQLSLSLRPTRHESTWRYQKDGIYFSIYLRLALLQRHRFFKVHKTFHLFHKPPFSDR
jgi:hypothetical protein